MFSRFNRLQLYRRFCLPVSRSRRCILSYTPACHVREEHAMKRTPAVTATLQKLAATWRFIAAALILTGFASAQNQPADLDLIIRDVTFVDVVAKQVLPHKTIGIRKGNIVLIADGGARHPARKVIDGSGYVALPGFVNTHTHLWQHISKSYAPKEKLQEWIRVYRPIHYLERDELRHVVLAASSEALLSGITSVSDYASLCFNDYAFEANAEAMRDAGLGGVVVWHNPSVFLPDHIKLQEIRRLREGYRNHFDIWMGFGGLSFWSLPQVYSGVRIAQTLNMPTTEHTMENIQEQRELYKRLSEYYGDYKDRLNSADRKLLEEMLALRRPSDVDAFDQLVRDAEQTLAVDAARKKLTPEQTDLLRQLKRERIISPLPVLDHLNVLPGYLAIHSVWQQKEDIELMRRRGVSVSHNPESNMYLSSGVAPVHEYLNSGVLVSLGTDGAASNDGINFFSAMREMWNLYKIDLMNTDVTRNFDEWVVLQAATINGAKALKIDGRTGSLTEGKEADIVLISKDELGMAPARPDKIPALLIYSANARNVRYVISDGNVVVENGRLVRYEENSLANKLSEIAAAVDERVQKGKIWSEEYEIASRPATPYWYKYRSVREPDSIKLSIRNSGPVPVRLTVISSGVTFGGGTAHVVGKEISDRFPEEPSKSAFTVEVILMPRQAAQVIKRPGQWEYELITPSTSLRRKSSSGQLLVLGEEATRHK